MSKDFDQLVEESKGRDIMAEIEQSRADAKAGLGKRTVVIVSDEAHDEDNA